MSADLEVNPFACRVDMHMSRARIVDLSGRRVH